MLGRALGVHDKPGFNRIHEEIAVEKLIIHRSWRRFTESPERSCRDSWTEGRQRECSQVECFGVHRLRLGELRQGFGNLSGDFYLRITQEENPG